MSFSHSTSGMAEIIASMVSASGMAGVESGESVDAGVDATEGLSYKLCDFNALDVDTTGLKIRRG